MKRLRSALWLPVVLASALATQGCATAIPAISALGSAVSLASWMNTEAKNWQVRPGTQNGLGDAEAESYRQGIRDTLAKLQRNGGVPAVASPRQPASPYYVGPVMQEVWVPAQVVGGMVIPAHRQWVVVRPGTWQVPGATGESVPAAAQPGRTQTRP
ncbi:MAG: hypothetical protein ACT4PE_10410 [Candidatus Eiseniibacteriota bacterium]